MLGVLLGTVGQQLGVTRRKQIAQPAHKHATSCEDEQKRRVGDYEQY